jgi:hypothetical protein
LTWGATTAEERTRVVTVAMMATAAAAVGTIATATAAVGRVRMAVGDCRGPGAGRITEATEPDETGGNAA